MAGVCVPKSAASAWREHSAPATHLLSGPATARLLEDHARPALGHVRIGGVGEFASEHLAVVEAEQGEEAQIRIGVRTIVEPWREEMEAVASGERDQLASVHHRSQLVECHRGV